MFESPDNWLPGTKTEKVAKVKNSGKVDEAVRISFTEEWKSANGTVLSGWVDKDGNVTSHESEDENDEKAAIINFANQGNWKKSTENGIDYYYYRYKVSPTEETSSFIKSVTFNKLVTSDSDCKEINGNGTRTVTCTSNGKVYDGATYTLTFTIETVQYDKYKEAWNTNVNIREDKGTSLASFVTTNGTKYEGNGASTYEFDVYFLGDNDKNNVVFADKCWKIVRTTETGGIKILYNGVPTDGKCNNSGDATTIGTSAFNTNYHSPAYVGYMYNTVYEYKEEDPIYDSKFSNDVEYNGTTYTLKEPTTTTKDNDHHYTCNNTTGTCETVRYYFSDYYYIELNGTENIESALKEMLSNDDVNKTDSTIKVYIDNWYEENMIGYTKYLEDTVFCNNRSISSLGSWDPNGDELNDNYLPFISSNDDLTCPNKVDKFTVSSSIGNGALKYPVGLLSSSEANLGGEDLRNYYDLSWLMTPAYFINGEAQVLSVSYGYLYYGEGSTGNPQDVRPVISLKPSTKYTSGDGTTNDPFLIPTD